MGDRENEGIMVEVRGEKWWWGMDPSQMIKHHHLLVAVLVTVSSLHDFGALKLNGYWPPGFWTCIWACGPICVVFWEISSL